MSITNLTNTTWVINAVPVYSPFTGITTSKSISYTSNGNSYLTFGAYLDKNDDIVITYQNGQAVYDSNGWASEAYRTVTITGGNDVSDSTLIAWFEANAAQYVNEVLISYKGSTIATMNASGTKTLETAGKYCEGDIEVEYTRPSAPSPSLQSKTVSPSLSQQTVSPDSGYDGLSSVTVNAMPSGTVGTPVATKGTVSNNSISVTPSVTNTTGYITGGTVTGTAVTVSANELVSGTKTITSAGTTDVTNYASASVAAGSARTPNLTQVLNPTISVRDDGLITASINSSYSIIPVVTEGYVSSGTSGTFSIYGSNTSQLTVYSGAHHSVSGLYTVAVSLTNPVNSGNFLNCSIYEALSSEPFDFGDNLATINSPTGSATVVIPSTLYGIYIGFNGTSPSVYSATLSADGGVSPTIVDSGTIRCEVTTSGSITIDGVDYDD